MIDWDLALRILIPLYVGGGVVMFYSRMKREWKSIDKKNMTRDFLIMFLGALPLMILLWLPTLIHNRWSDKRNNP
jgi:hypothetical protein